MKGYIRAINSFLAEVTLQNGCFLMYLKLQKE